MKVDLLSHTDEPENTVAAAAKTCYSAEPPDCIVRKMGDKYDSFIKKLAKMGHYSPFEHASFTFSISGVSRALSHQLVRHRIGASYSQKSQRYVEEQGFSYTIPNTVKKSETGILVYKEIMAEIESAYKKLIECGVDKEDARYVLPNACQTTLVVTMNARSLRNFFSLRCCSRAQWEIRELAKEMLKIVSIVAPALFEGAGAPCVNGSCPEGEMSCGQLQKP